MGCSWSQFVETLSAKLAFFPPAPSTYNLITDKEDNSMYLQPKSGAPPVRKNVQISVLHTSPIRRWGGNTDIVTAFIPHVNSQTGARAEMVVVFSHGNAIDLAQMLPLYRELARLLEVNVVGYDYSGYGCSSGAASVRNTLCDMAAVYNHVQLMHGFRSEQIILYGQSVGSGPSVWQAAQAPQLGGLVLHSPMLSGVRVLSPHLRWWPAWADVYPNHLLLPKVDAPTLVMHGSQDEVISIACGKRVYELCRNKYPPLWAEGYTHQNLEMCPEYLQVLKRFIAMASNRVTEHRNVLYMKQADDSHVPHAV